MLLYQACTQPWPPEAASKFRRWVPALPFNASIPADFILNIICMIQVGGEHDGEYLSGLMKAQPMVNCFASTPAALRMWFDQKVEQSASLFPNGMRHIILGGDEVTAEFVRRLFDNVPNSPDVQVRQVYGPTEGTILSSYGVLTHSTLKNLSRRRRVPIDRPMPHVAMTVATPSGNELPRGFAGEIIIWVRYKCVDVKGAC